MLLIETWRNIHSCIYIIWHFFPHQFFRTIKTSLTVSRFSPSSIPTGNPVEHNHAFREWASTVRLCSMFKFIHCTCAMSAVWQPISNTVPRSWYLTNSELTGINILVTQQKQVCQFKFLQRKCINHIPQNSGPTVFGFQWCLLTPKMGVNKQSMHPPLTKKIIRGKTYLQVCSLK